jgi:twinkle protein
MGSELRSAIFNAPVHRPDSIVTVTDLADKILKKPTEGLSWPWEIMTKLTYGIRSKQLITLGAGSGVGKTEFLTKVALHLAFEHKEKVGAIYLEQPPEVTALKIVGGMLNKRLHVPGDDWDEQEIRSCLDKIEDKIYFYNHFGGQDIDTVMSKIRYMVKGLGCRFIILDHLTALAAEMREERKGIDAAMSALGSLVQELDCTIFLVSHLAKPFGDGLSYEEGRRVTASSFRGSQSIQYWSSFMLGLERNKLAEDPAERNVLTVRILKDRFAGEADGEFFNLEYVHDNGELRQQRSII